MRPRSMIALLATLALLAVAGCGGADEGAGGAENGTAASQSGTVGRGGAVSGTVRFAVEEGPAGWEPWSSTTPVYLIQPYEGLVTRDPEEPREFLPRLATEWEQTDSEISFSLREGVVFHDGTPFDAEAVKTNIEAHQESGEGLSRFLTPIEEVVVDGEYEVTFRLSDPSPALIISLADTYMASPQAIADDTLARAPVGTGPWRHDGEASTTDGAVVMTYFEDYWDPEAVHLERIETFAIADPNARLSAVQTGEIDLADLDRPLYEQGVATGMEIITYSALPYQLVFLARQEGPLADVRVRRAICHGIDREAIAGLVPEGQMSVTTQRFGPGEYGHNPDLQGIPYDPEEARRLLAEADNPDVTIDMAVFEANQTFGEAMAGMLAELGVELRVQAVSPTEYFSSWRTGKWAVGLGTSSTEEAPHEYYSAYLSPRGDTNPFDVVHAEIEDAAQGALAAATLEEAEPAWQDMFKAVEEQAPACMFTILNENLIYDSDNLNVRVIPAPVSEIDWRTMRVVD